MITLELLPNEQEYLEYESQKQGMSIQEYIRSLLSDVIPTKAQNDVTPINPMIARAMANKNPSILGDGLELQREWRNEWE